MDDLIDFTPELRAEAMEIARNYVMGPVFTPPSIQGEGPNDKKGTIQMPGSVGGADWTGAAFDPESGTLFVPSMTNPFVANLLPGDPKATNLRYRAGSRALLHGPQGLPLVKPPYGRITALDLNRGEQSWMVPNGDGPRNHPAIRHLNLGPLGHAVRTGAFATKTLLFVTEGDQISVRTPPNSGGRKIRAHDKAHRGHGLGDDARRGRDRRADDLPAQRQAVHRDGDRRSEPPGGVCRAQPAVRLVAHGLWLKPA